MSKPKTRLFAVRMKVADGYGRNSTPDPAEQYWAVFPDRATAEDRARRLHREFVRSREPFAHPLGRYLFGERFEDLTSLPEFAFRDWLMDDGIEPPKVIEPTDSEPSRSPWMTDHEWRKEQARWAKLWAEWSPERRHREREQLTASLNHQAWESWWERAVVEGSLTPAQLAHLWEGLNKVSFFEVVEVPAARPPDTRTVFAIVHEHWEYDDCHCRGANDALAAYPTRAAAEAELARRQGELVVEYEAPGDRRIAFDGIFPNGGPNRLVVVELPLSPEG